MRCFQIGLLLLGVGAVLIDSATAEESPTTISLASPDDNISLVFRLTPRGEMRYGVGFQGQKLLEDCGLGLELEDGPALLSGWQVVDVARHSHDETWKPVYGERSVVRDRYEQVIIELESGQAAATRLRMTFRTYDQGIAFCYTLLEIPGTSAVVIRRERTEFRFLGNHQAWAVYSAQGRYARVPLSAIKPGCERPLTVQVSPQAFVAIAEAKLVDYARMKLGPRPDRPWTLVSELSGQVRGELPLDTPWRVIMIGESPGQLLENNDLLLNLNEPCAIDDTSWIRPGKVIREVTLTTSGGKACVDFAAEHGLQFVEFDAGWYGHEYTEDSDATTVTVDPKRSPGPLDLHEIIRYARQRDIGIIVYVNRRSLERQLDEILPLYQRWGIQGVKYGFVNVGSQQWTRWLHEAVRKAAEHRLMVDIHDEVRPTGYSRTYPNLMTQEGIAGDETSPSNTQTLAILFTRMLAGPGDNTICYYNERVDRNASHAYQLAKAVCIYSPWQFLFWYDRPPQSPHEKGGAGNSRGLIGDEPELEFFARVPTTWDETRVLHGRIGEYAVIARRSADQWFIGCMNANEPRCLSIPLDFLDAGKQYSASSYFDDPSAATRTHVGIKRQAVRSSTVLEVDLTAQGGQAIHIVPVH